MASYLDFLRMRNIFGPQQMGNDLPSQGGITGTMMPGEQSGMEGMADIWGQGAQGPPVSEPQVVPPESYDPTKSPIDVNRRYEELYQPRTEATDKFSELLKQYPTREQYKPSVLRRIGGALMAVGAGYSNQDPRIRGFQMNPGGVKAGLNFLDEPFNKAQEDWKEQVGPAQQAANLERYENVNSRTLAQQQVNAELKQRQDELRDANAKARIKIAELKAGGAEFDFKGPTVMAAYPDGRVVNTGVPTGHLSDADKIEANSKARLANTALANEGRQAVADTLAGSREALGEWSDILREVQPDGTTKYYQISKIDGRKREVGLTGDVTKLGTPGKGGATGGKATPEQEEALKTRAQEGLNEILALIDDKGTLTSVGKSTGGLSGYATDWFPTSEAYGGKSRVKRIKDILTLELLQELKNLSKTGATGFGQLNMKELGVLESAASKLDPYMGDELMAEELLRIREKLTKMLQPADSMTPSATVKKPSAQELVDKYPIR